MGYAYAIIGDFQLAEDAAQEAFIGAWLDLTYALTLLNPYRPVITLKSWNKTGNWHNTFFPKPESVPRSGSTAIQPVNVPTLDLIHASTEA